MHLVWIGLASTAATFLCGAVVLGMLHYASPEREDSLRALITVMARAVGLEPESGEHGRPDDPGALGAGRRHRQARRSSAPARRAS